MYQVNRLHPLNVPYILGPFLSWSQIRPYVCGRNIHMSEASTVSNVISFLFSSLSILEKLPESGRHRHQTSQCLRQPPHPRATWGQKRLQLLIWGVEPYISREGRFFFFLSILLPVAWAELWCGMHYLPHQTHPQAAGSSPEWTIQTVFQLGKSFNGIENSLFLLLLFSLFCSWVIFFFLRKSQKIDA